MLTSIEVPLHGRRKDFPPDPPTSCVCLYKKAQNIVYSNQNLLPFAGLVKPLFYDLFIRPEGPMKTLDIRTNAREEMVDLTPKIEASVASSGVENVLCTVVVP